MGRLAAAEPKRPITLDLVGDLAGTHVDRRTREELFPLELAGGIVV